METTDNPNLIRPKKRPGRPRKDQTIAIAHHEHSSAMTSASTPASELSTDVHISLPQEEYQTPLKEKVNPELEEVTPVVSMVALDAVYSDRPTPAIEAYISESEWNDPSLPGNNDVTSCDDDVMNDGADDVNYSNDNIVGGLGSSSPDEVDFNECKVVCTAKGRKAIEFKGFTYRFDKLTTSGVCKWRCLADFCRGRLSTFGHNPPLNPEAMNFHNHNPEDPKSRRWKRKKELHSSQFNRAPIIERFGYPMDMQSTGLHIDKLTGEVCAERSLPQTSLPASAALSNAVEQAMQMQKQTCAIPPPVKQPKLEVGDVIIEEDLAPQNIPRTATDPQNEAPYFQGPIPCNRKATAKDPTKEAPLFYPPPNDPNLSTQGLNQLVNRFRKPEGAKNDAITEQLRALSSPNMSNKNVPETLMALLSQTRGKPNEMKILPKSATMHIHSQPQINVPPIFIKPKPTEASPPLSFGLPENPKSNSNESPTNAFSPREENISPSINMEGSMQSSLLNLLENLCDSDAHKKIVSENIMKIREERKMIKEQSLLYTQERYNARLQTAKLILELKKLDPDFVVPQMEDL